jgi:transposase-like protein
MYQCRAKGCRKQFSVKVNTIFEDSPLPLSKWFVAVWSITNAKNGISSCELARALGVTQKSAWHMLHRVRCAMQSGTFKKFTGETECDETYVGGLSRNKHASKRKQFGRGPTGKAIVHGILERNGGNSRVKATVIPNTLQTTLVAHLNETIQPGATLYSDGAKPYQMLRGVEFAHQMIDHTERYVDGSVHTNSIENFWCLLKRSIKGTYVSVDAPHLNRYVGEQVFRFNERKGTDADRFAAIMPGIVGKKLDYRTLTGNKP